jgi:hypothetical protein
MNGKGRTLQIDLIRLHHTKAWALDTVSDATGPEKSADPGGLASTKLAAQCNLRRYPRVMILPECLQDELCGRCSDPLAGLRIKMMKFFMQQGLRVLAHTLVHAA